MKLAPSVRKRHYLAVVSLLLITAALIALVAGCGDDGYNPPPSEDLEIRTWYDLDDVRDNWDGNHILMNDLDSTTPGYEELASPTANQGKGWEPISLKGSFDGQGYEIRDMYICHPDEPKAALFGELKPEAVIRNVGVVDADVTGDDGVAGLVGSNYKGTLSNSYFTGSLTGEMRVGGLVALNNEGLISNCHYNYDETLINGGNVITIGALSGEDFNQWLANDKFLDVNERLSQEDGYYVVGNVTDFKQLLAFGQDDSLRFRLKNDLDLAADPNFHIPYLAGEFDGNGHVISNLSFNFAFVSNVGLFGYLATGGSVTDLAAENVSIIGTSFIGGLVGANWEGTVSNCYSTGNVTGTATRLDYASEEKVGGLVGASAGGTVSDSYSIASVSGKESVGGLVGLSYQGDVSNSYSTGSVVGIERVGGFVGGNLEGTVSNSYSTGSVNGQRNVGGLVGMNYATVRNSFWDTETSGQSTSAGGTGKNTTEMQDITTFSVVGWNIIAVGLNETNPAYTWNIVNNVTYPFLSWQSVS